MSTCNDRCNTRSTKASGSVTAMTKSSGNCQQACAKRSNDNKKVHNAQHKHTVASPKEVVLYGEHVVEVRIEKPEQKIKHTLPTTNLSPGQKAEKGRSTISNSKVPQRNWGDTLAKQNLLYMEGTQSSKRSANKEPEKNPNAKKQHKNGHCKIEEKHLKTPSCPSVFVKDRSVQYPEQCDNASRFAEFNPVRTLDFLMKELKDLVDMKDEKTCKIFTQMEQILSRIPENSTGPLFKDLEKKLEASTDQLKESGKKMEAMCDSWVGEREKLQSRIQKQDMQLKAADQKQANLAINAEILTKQSKEAIREGKLKDETISALKQQIENDERIISDLKTDLAKQTQLAKEYYFNEQYLTMDKDKLLKLFSYKDILITDYKNTIKELQNQIAEQLKILNKMYVQRINEGSTSSPIHTGPACSSPMSSSSDCSNKLHDLSNLSSIDTDAPQDIILKEKVPVKDSAHLELVSLLDGESSHTIMPDQNQVTSDKGTLVQDNDKNNRNVNENYVIAKKFLHDSSKEDHNRENDVYQAKKFQGPKERQNDNAKNSFRYNASKIPESVTSIKSIISDARKQDDIQSRIPVNVPSPLRDYPHPDWSESSLPSISTASDLGMVPSNDI